MSLMSPLHLFLCVLLPWTGTAFGFGKPSTIPQPPKIPPHHVGRPPTAPPRPGQPGGKPPFAGGKPTAPPFSGGSKPPFPGGKPAVPKQAPSFSQNAKGFAPPAGKPPGVGIPTTKPPTLPKFNPPTFKPPVPNVPQVKPFPAGGAAPQGSKPPFPGGKPPFPVGGAVPQGSKPPFPGGKPPFPIGGAAQQGSKPPFPGGKPAVPPLGAQVPSKASASGGPFTKPTVAKPAQAAPVPPYKGPPRGFGAFAAAPAPGAAARAYGSPVFTSTAAPGPKLQAAWGKPPQIPKVVPPGKPPQIPKVVPPSIKFPTPPKVDIPKPNIPGPEKIREVSSQQFRFMDANNDGKVTPAEVAIAKRALQAKKANAVRAGAGKMESFDETLLNKMSSDTFVSRADKNSDGQITLDEYTPAPRGGAHEL